MRLDFLLKVLRCDTESFLLMLYDGFVDLDSLSKNLVLKENRHILLHIHSVVLVQKSNIDKNPEGQQETTNSSC